MFLLFTWIYPPPPRCHMKREARKARRDLKAPNSAMLLLHASFSWANDDAEASKGRPSLLIA